MTDFIRALVVALDDTRELVRAAAANALGQISEPAVSALIIALELEKKTQQMCAQQQPRH